MKTNRLVLMLGTGAVLVTAPAHAFVHRRIETKIPFRFTVEDKTFPAGRYVIAPMNQQSPSALSIQKVGGKERAVFLTNSASSGSITETPQLVFDKKGRKRVLRAVYEGGSDSGAEFNSPPVPQKQVARAKTGKAAGKKTAVAANKRAPATTAKKTASR